MNIACSLETNAQLAAVGQPSTRAVCDPTMKAQPLTAFDALANNSRADPPAWQPPPTSRIVVPLVGFGTVCPPPTCWPHLRDLRSRYSNPGRHIRAIA